jgi:hypothetical protein
LALAHLRQVPAEIALDMRRARPVNTPDVRFDTFFFAYLGLAKSAFYILAKQPLYKEPIRHWRATVLDQRARTQFNRMMDLRDLDVHYGESDGKALPAMIPIKRSYDDDNWIIQPPSYAALGVARVATEHQNPDGSTVSSYEGLRGSFCLYVEIAGETCEASNACERFMAQLRTLIDSVSAAGLTPAAVSAT